MYYSTVALKYCLTVALKLSTVAHKYYPTVKLKYCFIVTLMYYSTVALK